MTERKENRILAKNGRLVTRVIKILGQMKLFVCFYILVNTGKLWYFKKRKQRSSS
jgi:hypothetical protein